MSSGSRVSTTKTKAKKKLTLSASKTIKLPKIESVFNENFELEYESYDTVYEGMLKAVNDLIIKDDTSHASSHASSHSSSGSRANKELLSRIPRLQDENQQVKKKKPIAKSKKTVVVESTEESDEEKRETMPDYGEDIVFDVEDMDEPPIEEVDSEDVDIDNLIQTRVGEKDVYYDPDKSIVYNMKFQIIGFVNDEGELEIELEIEPETDKPISKIEE